MEDHEDWLPNKRRPTSNIMDYASPTDDEDNTTTASTASTSLARMQSQSYNNRFHHLPRHGKAAASSHSRRPRPLNSPTGSISGVTSMPIPIPSNPSTIPGNTLPSAPASPPTPAPSPTPMSRAPDWSTADPSEDIDLGESAHNQHASYASSSASVYSGFGYRHMRACFADLPNSERQRMLAELLNMCDGKTLAFVANFVAPRLKRDPFSLLPNELCLRILTFIDDPKTLARSSQVSKRWRELVSDDMAWKSLCEKHAYRRMSDEERRPRGIPSPNMQGGNATAAFEPFARPPQHPALQHNQHPYGYHPGFPHAHNPALVPGMSSSAPDLTRRPSTPSILPSTLSSRASSATSQRRTHSRPKAMSYRSHFKQRYQVETAWRTGGAITSHQITPDQGVVTSLHLTPHYIIVALDNAKIHVFDVEGRHLRCLQGHVMGVWAMVPQGDILVSGGCDRDVRVWDLSTGEAVWMLRGHTSTVRCLKMSGKDIAISGSRDTTLRIWDIKRGTCRHVLVGHQASVRCLEIHGDLVVSGSYDTTARIWSISEVAFDGRRVATGSLDTSVRVWDPHSGRCLAQLQGHTSLVGQLQLRGDTLVTGGSDGSVRVWSLQTYSAVHRLAAHDNSVTSLQFDESRIVSGGSDGRVKVWDLYRGVQIRELGSPAEAVWRVVFEEEKAVVLASRAGKTVMEVWSFAPPPEEQQQEQHLGRMRSNTASPLAMPAIAPYQDPAYGEKPTYPRTASFRSSKQPQQLQPEEAQEQDIEQDQDLDQDEDQQEQQQQQQQLQDEVMSDVYDCPVDEQAPGDEQ